MEITIERLASLFDEDICNEMLDIVAEDYQIGCCHYNSAMIAVSFEDWQCVNYVEGYLNGYIGHAINSYTDANGTIHYFDITQEFNIAYVLPDLEFITKFEVVKSFSAEKIKNIFDNDKTTHLVSVKLKK